MKIERINELPDGRIDFWFREGKKMFINQLKPTDGALEAQAMWDYSFWQLHQWL